MKILCAMNKCKYNNSSGCTKEGIIGHDLNGICIQAHEYSKYSLRPVMTGYYVVDEDGNTACSVCGETGVDSSKTYCPNCGAKLL